MSNIELQPCPFCGSRTVEYRYASVDCLICGCYGPVHDVREKAIAAWNRRAADTQEARSATLETVRA